jgi:subtilisin family serine protease
LIDRLLVALIDSGVNPSHPHLAGTPVVGFGLDLEGEAAVPSPDFADRTGHGTACAAALVRVEPRVQVLAVRVLDDELRTSSRALAEAIVLSAERGARLLNLSLGSRVPEARPPLEAAVRRAADLGAICVAAAHPRDLPLWPADLPDVLSATTHASCPLGVLYRTGGPLPRYLACGWPRPIEGRPPTDNLFGPSVAAAHLCAQVASLLLREPGLELRGVVERLDRQCTGTWAGPV